MQLAGTFGLAIGSCIQQTSSVVSNFLAGVCSLADESVFLRWLRKRFTTMKMVMNVSYPSSFLVALHRGAIFLRSLQARSKSMQLDVICEGQGSPVMEKIKTILRRRGVRKPREVGLSGLLSPPKSCLRLLVDIESEVHVIGISLTPYTSCARLFPRFPMC